MNTFYLLIVLTTIVFSSKNTNSSNLLKKPSQYCLIRCLLYSTKNIFQYYISPFLFSEDLVKIFNSFKFQAQKKCNKIEIFFPNSEWKTYVLIQDEQQERSTLYHFLKDENFNHRLILFSEKTKTAKAINKNFKGCDENLVTIVYDDIVPFDSISYICGNKKRIMLARTEDKYTLLLKTKKEYSTICCGAYFWENDIMFLQNESQTFIYPDDLPFFLKAKQSKKYLTCVSILFWNKNFRQNYFKFIKFLLSTSNVIAYFKLFLFFTLMQYLVNGEISIMIMTIRKSFYLCVYHYHNKIAFSLFVATIFPFLLPVVPFLFPIWYYSVSMLQFINTTLLLPLIPLLMAFNYFSGCLTLPNVSLPLLEKDLISTCALILREWNNIRNSTLHLDVRDVFLIVYGIQLLIFFWIFLRNFVGL